MLGDRTQGGHWKKQQSAEDHDGAEQKTAESKGIVPQGSEAEGGFLFVS